MPRRQHIETTRTIVALAVADLLLPVSGIAEINIEASASVVIIG
jgi:hypothetical protein